MRSGDQEAPSHSRASGIKGASVARACSEVTSPTGQQLFLPEAPETLGGCSERAPKALTEWAMSSVHVPAHARSGSVSKKGVVLVAALHEGRETTAQTTLGPESRPRRAHARPQPAGGPHEHDSERRPNTAGRRTRQKTRRVPSELRRRATDGPVRARRHVRQCALRRR